MYIRTGYRFLMIMMINSSILNASSTSLDLLRQDSIDQYLGGIDLIGPELEANAWMTITSFLLDIFQGKDGFSDLPEAQQKEIRSLLYDKKDIRQVHQRIVELYKEQNQESLGLTFLGSENLSQYDREEQLHELIKKSMQLVAKGLINLEEANEYQVAMRSRVTHNLAKKTCFSCGILLPCMIYYLLSNYCNPCLSTEKKAWKCAMLAIKELKSLLRRWNEDYEKIAFTDLQILIRDSAKFPKPIVLLVESYLAHDKFLGLSDSKLKSFKGTDL